jgi:hypothetical protein
LVRIVPPLPELGITRSADGTATVSWDAVAAGYTLESSASLGSSADWNPVSGVPSPIAAAGSTTVNLDDAQFYRLRK